MDNKIKLNPPENIILNFKSHLGGWECVLEDTSGFACLPVEVWVEAGCCFDF
jgi:hypothetical protein